MKMVFVGPTLPDARTVAGADIILRPPARQGDVAAAVSEGAHVIGLIDGLFENVPPVWHKEILFALSKGVTVYGAASMGALRAAECAAFGMIGVGGIFKAYRSGELLDDAAVAQIHGPAELGYLPLSEPLVNVIATLEHLSGTSQITPAEMSTLTASAESLFFKQRSYRAVVDAANLPDPERREELCHLLRSKAVNRKRDDALELLHALSNCPDERSAAPCSWTFMVNSLWRERFRPPEIEK